MFSSHFLLCRDSKHLTVEKTFRNKLESRVTFIRSDERDASPIKPSTEEPPLVKHKSATVCTSPLMNQSARSEGRNKCAQQTGAGADTGLFFSPKFLLEPR